MHDQFDGSTADYYRRYAHDGALAAEAPSRDISSWFGMAFKAGARILDIGAGSGRDIACLCALVCDADGIEPNDAMHVAALQRRPPLGPRLAPGA